jgi:hypothetical protein
MIKTLMTKIREFITWGVTEDVTLFTGNTLCLVLPRAAIITKTRTHTHHLNPAISIQKSCRHIQ